MLVDTQKLVTPQKFRVNSILILTTFHHAHERVICKIVWFLPKSLRSNQILGVNQCLGVTPKCQKT